MISLEPIIMFKHPVPKNPVASLLANGLTRTLAICSLALVVGTLSGCGGSNVKIPEVPSRTALPSMAPSRITLTPAQEQDIHLTLKSAKIENASDTLQTTGKVQAVSNLLGHTYSPVQGQVVSVPVTIGQTVRQGQLLAWVRSDQIGQLEADFLQNYLQNKADMHQAKVQLALSKAVSQRESQLFADKVSARADMETARAQYEKDLASLEALQIKQQALITSLQSRLSLYGAPSGTAIKLAYQNKIYPYLALRASRNGVLISRNVNPGELVDTSKELFSVADLSRVWLVGDIYERDLERVHLKQLVQVTLDSVPNKVFDGRVSFIDTMLDPQARTLEIHSEVHNDQLLLKPNMFARVEIQLGQKKVLAVPRTAIQRNGDNNYVYVPVGPHTYEEREVTTGIKVGSNQIEITDGLKEGDQVVSQGTLSLKGEILKQSASAKTTD